MPWELQIIRASEFVRLDATERLDFQASREMLKTFAQACLKRGLNCALTDLRRIPKVPVPQFNATELDGLVRVFIEAGFTRHQRLAILYEDEFGGAKKFAFISRMRGLKVQAFNRFEEAIRWLAEGSEAEALWQSRRQEAPVPITGTATNAQKIRVVSATALRAAKLP